jgi:hypothetical protein
LPEFLIAWDCKIVVPGNSLPPRRHPQQRFTPNWLSKIIVKEIPFHAERQHDFTASGEQFHDEDR